MTTLSKIQINHCKRLVFIWENAYHHINTSFMAKFVYSVVALTNGLWAFGMAVKAGNDNMLSSGNLGKPKIPKINRNLYWPWHEMRIGKYSLIVFWPIIWSSRWELDRIQRQTSWEIESWSLEVWQVLYFLIVRNFDCLTIPIAHN